MQGNENVLKYLASQKPSWLAELIRFRERMEDEGLCQTGVVRVRWDKEKK